MWCALQPTPLPTTPLHHHASGSSACAADAAPSDEGSALVAAGGVGCIAVALWPQCAVPNRTQHALHDGHCAEQQLEVGTAALHALAQP
mmetsp:Transcript_28820/g.63500  ORF Transcript_28820/g.63500 Transcript_28820/m.63500 type:complete len:89 (-) Transcript_28820:41-307(-)